MTNTIKYTLFALILPFFFGCVTSAPRRTCDINVVGNHEAAILKVPANIDIIAFDGERLAINYMPMSSHSEFRLLPGRHVLLLRYSGLSDGATFDQKQELYSPKVETTLNAEKSHEYLIRYEVPAVDMKFDKEIKSLTVWIEDAKTKTVVCAPVTAGRAVAKKSDSGPQKPTVSVPPESSGDDFRPPLEQLKQWWGKASASERGEFLKWSVMPKSP